MSGGPRESARERPGGGPAPASWRSEALWLLPILLVAAAIYAGALDGGFVYDDQRQIVRNTLIQDPARLGEALRSDVWAFKGGEGPASNFWRPTFVLWLAANVRAFGLANPAGWHAAVITLHVLATGLAFRFTRRTGAGRPAAAAVALLFAVHPVHVESVAWISGGTDPLAAVFLLATLLAALRLAEQPTIGRWTAMLLCFALALGAKEIAVLAPLVVFVLVAMPQEAPRCAPRDLRRALILAAPLVLLAIAFLVARGVVLGRQTIPYAGGLSLAENLATLPSAALFYFRQAVAPFDLGPSYPLRAVAPTALRFTNFVLPLALLLLLGAGTIWLARRSRPARAGTALLLWLLPALYLRAFQPEQLVHDRYLYLPLLGVLLLLVIAFERVLQRFSIDGRRSALSLLAIALVLALPLAAETVSYTEVWGSELALWQRGVRSDPGSAFNWMQLGATLEAAGRPGEALAALDRALAIAPTPRARLAHARAALGVGAADVARGDLEGVLARARRETSDAYTLYQTYESLAIVHDRAGRFGDAAQLLRQARTELPFYAAALTEKLAVVLYRSGDREGALRELEAQRRAARSESLPESRWVLYRIGLLQSELGREREARAAFEEFLDATRTLDDPPTRALRRQVAAALDASGAVSPR